MILIVCIFSNIVQYAVLRKVARRDGCRLNVKATETKVQRKEKQGQRDHEILIYCSLLAFAYNKNEGGATARTTPDHRVLWSVSIPRYYTRLITLSFIYSLIFTRPFIFFPFSLHICKLFIYEFFLLPLMSQSKPRAIKINPFDRMLSRTNKNFITHKLL